MNERIGWWIERAAVAAGFVILVWGAAGGQTWWSGDAIVATNLDRAATSPLYGVVSTVAAYLPIGEPGFRLALLNCALACVVLLGVIRLCRRLLPNDPLATVPAICALFVTQAFHDGAGFAGPAMLAAAGTVWAVYFAAHTDLATGSIASRHQRAALACAAVVLGTAPWLGVAVVGLIALRGSRPLLINALAIVGLAVIALWSDALGELPELSFAPSELLASLSKSPVIVGLGLLGIGFGVATGLAQARWLAGALAIALIGGALRGGPLPALSLLAVGCAITVGAIVRSLPPAASQSRIAASGVVGLPIAAAALLINPTFATDDPGNAPARVASELIGAQPPGPGVFFARREAVWTALAYAQRVAGARPDIELASYFPDEIADALAHRAIAVRAITGSDVPAFGRLDPHLAYPRGRGFQLVDRPPTIPAPIPQPARYQSAVGGELATLFALARGRYEAIHGRLGAAARAAGLAERFGAADLAILSTTAPSRPAMFSFVPDLEGRPPGRWLIELFGDDLAWVAGLSQPTVEAPAERKLHALWRALWLGKLPPDDPSIAALGPQAIEATKAMAAALAPAPPPSTPVQPPPRPPGSPSGG